MDKRDEITIRAVTDADIPTMVPIIHAAFKEYDGAIDPPSGAHKESVVKIREQMTTDRALLALLDQQALACVLYRAEGTFMYFGSLAVLPEYRGRGVAGA